MLPFPNFCILLICFSLLFITTRTTATSFNLSLPHQHPDPESIAQDVQRTINASVSRRQLLSTLPKDQCQTGNPIDDCWRCDPNWANNRQRLADCTIGFGQGSLGGRGGQIYVVTDSSDHDPSNPTPGTLRYGVIQNEPLWIIFASSMTIKLKHELIFNSYKTIDGRGANVHITGNGCLTLQYVSHIIIHNIHIHHCKPSGNTNIAASPTHVGYRGRSDGDGISIFGSQKIWIDHCSLSYCTDGLIDAIMGSTGITISNNYFSHHDEVMLLGHDDKYVLDSGMQVTIAFNRFGQALVQRMPRCRRGYIHVVNNDFLYWEMYAIGGSANPTINSQGNRYVAPADPNAKEVTKRVETDEKDWADWNWRTDGDVLINGAFFVPSGAGLSAQYAKASSVEPKSAALITQLTLNAGVFGDARERDEGISNPGFIGGGTTTGTTNTGSAGSTGGDGDYFGMIFGSGASPSPPPLASSSSVVLSVLIIIVLYAMATNDGAILSFPLSLLSL
ncbi:probable pectate lyase 13 [Ricinus communis]|uniref:Pectate lyase n=1 Tax=Ricinus communis TaxID=3988 RepID=B9T6Z7_RICCO|nr:probable pectate lyase 13 [Ricinus communis]EEF28369.1 Pectate lyase precursor, putative [Ricinus communis]|eukprot:XP_002534016.1 probable pectate lyase 13 [Ricinus communis]